ncbi:MAG: hypothetical protein GY856_07890 [bacterium]|nr:hypothetical protein [bacterium]
MPVQDLNRVHRRYIHISNGFKSAWTFHQFIQGLRKLFVEDGPPDYPADFQAVYNDLKEVSQNLAEQTTELASQQLDDVERGLAPLVQALLAADKEVSPGLLRRFFQRVKNYDDNILSQLVKFYLYFRDSGGWESDRLDKADYLTTKVSEEYLEEREVFVLRDRTHIREVAQGFWAALAAEEIVETEAEALSGELETFRRDISAVDSIDDLHKQNLVQRYRDLKHRLGDTYFHPKVLPAIVESNLVLKNQTQQLYHRDEQRIIAEYQQVFELERDVPVDVQLKEELDQFREAVDRFEERLQKENVRLEELATLREKVRELMPKLKPEVPVVLPAAEKAAGEPAVSADDEYVAEPYAAIFTALDDTDSMTEPRKIALQPEVFGLGLEAREVVAYRRLSSRAACDRGLEEFILRAAALRVRIESEVEEIKGILDDTAITREAPVFAVARATVRRADLVLRRFEHLIEQTVLDAEPSDGQEIQVLKMRLMRAFAGLWLMVNKS